MTRIEVSLKKLEDRSYSIFVGHRCLAELERILSELELKGSVFIVTDDNTNELWARKIKKHLEHISECVKTISIPPGEEQKSLRTIEKLARKLINMEADRTSTLVAVGGGVIGDITGFLASIFLRGVAFINIPTTLLAQVDSSVGGKTGVDLIEGKNLVGTFYQPRLVFTDVDFLSTLPREEFLNGMAEVIKYGIIMDYDFFEFLEANVEKILGRDPDVLVKTVSHCCKLKRNVVEDDEKESGLRRILNFGHTIAHSVESASNYRVKHGWAVAVGMVAATLIAVGREIIEPDDARRIETLIGRFGLPVSLPENLSSELIINGLSFDKKRRKGVLHWVLPRKIGSVEVVTGITRGEIKNAIEKLQGKSL